MSKKNQSSFVPDVTLDLLNCTPKQATPKISNLRTKYPAETNLRIIVGKAAYSNSPPVIPTLVKKMLNEQELSWSYAKVSEGGDGAIDLTVN